MIETSKHAVVDSDKQYLTIDELAQILEIDVAVLKDWAKIGKIPSLKEGNSWKFERAKIEAWLASEQIK